MKTVFSSNSELAHVWANQLQSEGRTGNMFFEGPVIYSYGTHYEIARFVTAPNGQRVCFVNSNYYSSSTAKHTNHVLNAIPDGIFAFKVPFIKRNGSYWVMQKHYFDINELSKVIESMLIQCRNLVYDQLKAVSNFFYFLDANEKFDEIKEICNLFDLDIPARPENWDKAKEKADYLRSTQGEREKAKDLKKLEKEKELLNRWLNNEYHGQLYGIPVHLRVSKDGTQIETTKGAKVETAKALVLLEKLQKFDAVGENINGFTVIENTLDYVKIGCHVIAWPVINQVFNTKALN
jgi:hypothetical protein